jgi:adenosylcobinamide-GDP ribazoletransferase
MPVRAIIALLQFTTILPLGRSVDLACFGRRLYLYPVAGYVIGGIAAITVWFLGRSPLAAGLALGLVLLLSGFHHLDGLLDTGDALMVHGDQERRRQVLLDRHVGTGGVGMGMVVTLLAFSALLAARSPGIAILSGEVCAKVAMGGLTIVGPPFKEGIHQYLHRFTRPWFLPPVLLFLLPLLLVLPWHQVVLLFVATLLIIAGMRSLSLRLFGGVNGDLVGATNEITRALAIVMIVLSASFPL